MDTLEEECKSESKSNSNVSNGSIVSIDEIIYEPMIQRKTQTRFNRIAQISAHNNLRDILHDNNNDNNNDKKKKKRTHSMPPTPSIFNNKTSKRSTSLPPKRPFTKTPKKRRIKPKIIEIRLNKECINRYFVNRNEWRLKYPKKRKIRPKLLNKKIVKPELIGNVSNESIVLMNQINKYFNANNCDSMFNEQNFAKYTINNNNNNNHYYQYYQYHFDENSTPIIIDKKNKEKEEKEEESDISICSNPDDPLTISSYRRKMIITSKHKTTPKKITDYFSPI